MDNDEVIKIAWVVLAVIVSAAEIFVPGFFLLPFGLGAGAAAIAAFAGMTFIGQLVVFVAASALFFAALRPLARRLNQIDEPQGVGANRLIHQRGVVTDSIGPNDPGFVRIDREDWRADSVDDTPLPAGTPIRVVEVRGTRVLVEAATSDTSTTDHEEEATS